MNTVAKIYECGNGCKILGRCYTVTNLTTAFESVSILRKKDLHYSRFRKTPTEFYVHK